MSSTNRLIQRALARTLLLRQNQRHDETIQAQGFGKNQNQNHSDKQLFLLPDRTNACITDHTDGHTRREAT